MRVALVTPYSLSVPGGVQGQVLGLARALNAAGHRAVVLGPVDAPLRPGVADDLAESFGLSPGSVFGVGRSQAVPANGSVARLALGPLSARRAWGALAAGRYDVLHLHEPLAPGTTWACLLRPEPKVGTFHRAGGEEAYRWMAPASHRAARRLAARCAVSEQARSSALVVAGGRAQDYEIIGNGVELERFSEPAPWPVEGPTVLFVGRHEQRKGLAVLLEAFGRLGRPPGAVLWVAGDGPETDALRRRAVPGVRWLGRVDDEELARRLAGAQVLCAPSLHGESFGVVLTEAMAAGTAVVASDLPGYAAVADGCGELVPPGDAGALARALESALADVAAGVGRGAPDALEAARRRARQWSMDAVAERYVAVYERILGR
ncbi:MAG TPA: glycosyltransferase family 4 protein [Acidimicrobiales bacterium]|nr:glycosyltransferase family 4 protein [Acidimicrobiales bacterium]